MERRTFVATLAGGLLAAPLAAEGQPTKTTYRIGVLSPGASPPGPLEAFREGLRDLGYVDGQTVVIEWRFAEGNERLPMLADELVRLKVDVIFAVNTPAVLAAKKATTTIPIVVARLADPVKTGLAIYTALRMPWPNQPTVIGLALAGVYSVSPIKRASQARCRELCALHGPLPFNLMRSATVAGVRYGLSCIGCSAALMVAMVLLGMSHLWWAVILASSCSSTSSRLRCQCDMSWPFRRL